MYGLGQWFVPCVWNDKACHQDMAVKVPASSSPLPCGCPAYSELACSALSHASIVSQWQMAVLGYAQVHEGRIPEALAGHHQYSGSWLSTVPFGHR